MNDDLISRSALIEKLKEQRGIEHIAAHEMEG